MSEVDADDRDSPLPSHRIRKKKMFSSFGKVLRRRHKSKSKSLSDLTQQYYGNYLGNIGKNDSIDNDSITSGDSSIHGTNSISEDNYDIEALNDEISSSLGGDYADDDSIPEEHIIRSSSHEMNYNDDAKSVGSINLFENIPEGTTAATIWKSGVCSFFSVEGTIKCGERLIARDASGTSDPYVKVKLRSKCVYKTKIVFRSLYPQWNESFQIPVDDINTDLGFKVYDFDRLSYDDYMGEAQVCLGALEINKEIELKLSLINQEGIPEDFGQIIVSLSIIPKTPNEKVELSHVLTSAKRNPKTNSRSQLWDSLLSVILVEGKNFKTIDPDGNCDPFIRFKLGADKYKSKISKQTVNPIWHEQFDMKMFVCNGPLPVLEMTVWDKSSGRDELIGRANLDLSILEAEKSVFKELELEGQTGSISLHLAITAQSMDEIPDKDPEKHIHQLEKDLSLVKTMQYLKKVGWLQVQLHRAVGLAIADLGGASDPFAVLEVVNQRLVTPTIYKTLNPKWEKVYEITIYDIHDVLEITVFDEDKSGAPDFLGRVKIPLLSITSGEKRLYQLKDKRLQHPAKGHLIITFNIVFNPIRASIRTFNPKEVKVLDEPPRFRRALLQENVDRLSNLIRSIISTGEFIQSLFTWEYKFRSAFAFSIYLLLVTNFDWFMLPLILFLVLLKNYVVYMLSPGRLIQDEDSGEGEADEDDEDEDDKSKKGKSKTLKEKIDAISNICTLVQNRMDTVASFGERIKNTFNWTIPFLSYLLMVILLLATIILYAVPLRYILLAWGINKFTKRIRKPNAISNNELMDFLSRIPSDPEIKQRHPLKPDTSLG